MLERLRAATGGIVAKILLGILVISFAVWGASDAFMPGGPGEVIRVGDTRVSAVDYRLAYLNRMNALERQLGQPLTQDQAKALGIEQSITNQLVAGAVLDQTAREMGLGISDEQLAKAIGDDPSFKDASGRFSRERLEATLRTIGMDEDAYVENQQSVAKRGQLVTGLAQGIEPSDALMKAIAQYQNEKRVFDYAIIDRSAVTGLAEPTETDLSTYFEANKPAYMAPEYRKLAIVRLTATDIAKPDAVTSEEVTAEYEASKARYTQPEQRRILQVAFKDTAAAKAAADRLATGVTIETILGELGRTLADADLGLLRKDQIPDKTVAEAAFALSLNSPSGVVEGAFGPVVLSVTEIVPEKVTPLADLEAELRKAVAERKAADILFETHDKIEDERAAGDPLADAAAKAGLKAITIEMVDAMGNGPDGKPVEGIPQAQAVLAEAFQTDEGVEADPVNIGSEGFVWFEVAGVTQERQKPLSEVRDAVRTAWIDAETTKKIEEVARSIADRISKGEDFAAVLASVLPSSTGTAPQVKVSAEMLRTDTGADFQAAAVEAGFRIPQGKATIALATEPPAQIVIRVSKVIEADAATAPAQLRDNVGSQIANDLVSGLVNDLQSRKEVIVNPAAIDAAVRM
jgi:peptidyl-prolyl cis-trans isomerase D